MEIQKQTYVEADEQTTKGMTYDLLQGLHQKIDALRHCYELHLGICDGRFKKIENRKVMDKALAAGSGVVGGFLANIAQFFGLGK